MSIVKMSGVCAACPVDVGQCPACGTFWIRGSGKRYGVLPTTDGGGPTSFDGWPKYHFIDDRPNVITRPAPAPAEGAEKENV